MLSNTFQNYKQPKIQAIEISKIIILQLLQKNPFMTQKTSLFAYCIFLIVAVCLIQIAQCDNEVRKCQPNSNMKYQLNHTYELKGYHSMCSEFSKRTCCSGKNFEALAKKISTKVIGPGTQSHPLSHLCRRRLTTLLCSTCDGDIGDKSVEGVCQSVCQNVYESCKEDYFSIDSLNKIKICRDDDIICSKLVDIIPHASGSVSLCQMLGIDTSNHDCWNGIPSWNIKGVPKSKTAYHVKPKRQKTSPSAFGTYFDLLSNIETRYWVYVALLSVLLGFFSYKWLSIRIKNQGRKLKNL